MFSRSRKPGAPRNDSSGVAGRSLLLITLGLAMIITAHPGCRRGKPAHNSGLFQSALLISIDTLRADHLSCYGYPEATSPHLDGFLGRGARFRYALSTSSRTAPSHVSLMTGMYPSFTTVDVENGMYPLNADTITLAECARAAGLRTAAVVSNPVLSRRLNLHQGFEIYNDNLPRAVAVRGQRERVAADTVASALELIERFRGERFFIWIHIQDPHGPYSEPGRPVSAPIPDSGTAPDLVLPPGEDHSGYQSIPRYQLIGSDDRLADYIRRYDEEIRYFDRELGRLLDYLDSTGLLEHTLVAFTADHGEAFGEDEFYCAHGHGSGLDQARVPLGFVGPGITPGAVFHNAVSNIDVFSTLLQALGLEEPEDSQSRSLLDALIAGTEPDERIGFTESVTQRAVFSGTHYLRRDRYPLEDEAFWRSGNPYTGAPHIPLGQVRWIHLGRTPEEERVFPGPADPDPTLQKLSRELDRFSGQADRSSDELMAVRRNRYDQPLDGSEEQQLRALGYME